MSLSDNPDEFLPGEFRVEFLDRTAVDGADTVRITVSGELDLATGPTLLRYLDHNAQLHASPTAELVVDLA